MDALEEKSHAFARVLEQVANGTVADGVVFEAQRFEGTGLAWIWPLGSSHGVRKPIPVGGPAQHWIEARFQVRLDDHGDHLAVESSIFALCIDERGRPALRIEYDRERGNEPDRDRPGVHKRPAAHVQIHGASGELSFALAMNGQPPRSLESFHFPVGGRRFRPTFEDFIEFLIMESLISPVKEDWRETIIETRGDWMKRQVQATVRRYPDSAADQLAAMGWSVAPPTE